MNRKSDGNMNSDMIKCMGNKKLKAYMGAKTCTQLARNTKQPRGGYISPRQMVCIDMADDAYRAELVGNMGAENLSPATIGVAVDYLTRYAMECRMGPAENCMDLACLDIPRHGIRSSGAYSEEAFKAVAKRLAVHEINDDTIDAICVLTAWDTMYRSGLEVDMDSLHPDEVTRMHIRMMVEMALRMMEGEVRAIGPTFEGGMPMNIHSADADYIIDNWLVDMKVSKKDAPDTTQTLQLLMYYIMGKLASNYSYTNPSKDAFDAMDGIEIINPRCGVVWKLKMDEVSDEITKEVLEDVMGGYSPDFA